METSHRLTGKEISVKKVRKYFFTDEGFPKKEYLKTCYDILKILHLDIGKMTKPERYYFQKRINDSLRCIRKQCTKHHILWVDAKKAGIKYVLHGFTHNEDLINSHIERSKERAKIHEIVYRTVKKIADQQLELDFAK